MGFKAVQVHPLKFFGTVTGHLQSIPGHTPLHMSKNVFGRQLLFPLLRLQAPGGHRRRGGLLGQSPLRVGEFPQPRQQSRVWPAAQGNLSLPQQEEHRLLLNFAGLFGLFHRQCLRRAPDTPQTEVPHRAAPAFRRSVGDADRGAQLHGGLVEDADILRLWGHDGLELVPDGFFRFGVQDIVVAVGKAGHHPQDVAVHRRLPPAKGRGGDGAGSVVPNARQSQQALIGIRKTAAAFRHDLRRLLKIPGPAVIAQPLPQLHQVLLRRVRQSLHRGEGREKPGIIAQHRRHPGLLEHDLRHPDAVGVPGMAPGQVPGVGPVPGQKGLRQAVQHVFSCQLLSSHGIIIPYPAADLHPSGCFFEKPLDLPPSGRCTIAPEMR